MSFKVSKLRKVSAPKLSEFLSSFQGSLLSSNKLKICSLPPTLKVNQQQNLIGEFVYTNFAICFPQMLKFSRMCKAYKIHSNINIFNVYNKIVINFGSIDKLTQKQLAIALLINKNYETSKEGIEKQKDVQEKALIDFNRIIEQL